MLKHYEFLSLELRGRTNSWKTTPQHHSSSNKLYTWHSEVRQVPFSWQPPQQLGHGNPFHEALYAEFLSQSEGHEVWRSVVINSAESWQPLRHYAPQHQLNLLWDFMWPKTLWLSCWCYQLLLPITVDYGIFGNEKISWLDLLQMWHPITVPHWNSLISWDWPILSQMFVEAVCTPRCWILQTCGHESDWNALIQYLHCWVNTFGNVLYILG